MRAYYKESGIVGVNVSNANVWLTYAGGAEFMCHSEPFIQNVASFESATIKAQAIADEIANDLGLSTVDLSERAMRYVKFI